jgi:hypothetical protein
MERSRSFTFAVSENVRQSAFDLGSAQDSGNDEIGVLWDELGKSFGILVEARGVGDRKKV